MARSKLDRLLSRLNSTDVYVGIMAVVMLGSMGGSLYEDYKRGKEIRTCEKQYQQSCTMHQLAVPDSAAKDPELLNHSLYRTIELLK